jgi:hypothetical protein
VRDKTLLAFGDVRQNVRDVSRITDYRDSLKQAVADGVLHEDDPILRVAESMVEWTTAGNLAYAQKLRKEITHYLKQGAEMYAQTRN